MSFEYVREYRESLELIHLNLLELASRAAHSSIYREAMKVAQSIEEPINTLRDLEIELSSEED